MIDRLDPPAVWLHVPKGKPGPKVRTATQVPLWANGMLSIPSAAYDALGVFERVHLFVAEDRPGYLWIVPAEDDNEDAYRLTKHKSSDYARTLTATDLPERLRLDPDLDVVRGDWKIFDDQVVIVFPVLEEDDA